MLLASTTSSSFYLGILNPKRFRRGVRLYATIDVTLYADEGAFVVRSLNAAHQNRPQSKNILIRACMQTYRRRIFVRSSFHGMVNCVRSRDDPRSCSVIETMRVFGPRTWPLPGVLNPQQISVPLRPYVKPFITLEPPDTDV